MSVLKLQAGLRGIHPQCLASNAYPGHAKFASGKEEDTSQSHRHLGTFSSTFSRRFRAGDAHRTEKSSDDLNVQSPLGASPPAEEKKDRMKINFSSLGATVPLRIAEMNRYFADTSKKFLSSRNPLNRNGTSSNSTMEEKSVPTDQTSSLEHSLTQMNQSIISFYDTSCATNAPHQAENMIQRGVAMQESVDDDSVSADTPQTIGPLFPTVLPAEMKKKRAEARRAQKISRLSLESRTKALVQSLKSAHSLMSKITRAEELCEHLIAHPECVWDAASEKAVPCVKKLTASPDKLLKGLAHEILSLLGHVKPLSAPGIRVLSIDGGGTRGLVTIEFLKALEKQSGRKIHELFDYVCGVSTGALLAILICLYKLPLDRCEELYKDCSTQMFTRNRVLGTTKLVWSYGFYDSQSWEEILKREMGEKSLIEFARDPDVPKVSAISSLMNSQRMSSHLFRTYNTPPGASSQYPGSCRHKVWEVVRASSAAPGYFESFKLGDEVHEDGGILTNNPTALGIHESRLLWPKENFHCVVSLGTGRFDNSSISETPAKMSLKRKITTIVDSATDTEAVHQTLQDLLPARTYFRFNPYLSEEFMLDEIRPEKMAQMQLDAQMYTRRNSYKLTAVSDRLMEKRKPQQVAGDWMKRVLEQV
ncbi:calcium-independent phospholipase A2-gamma [Aplysia californica]|uniref:Calcium-independent phospholipase A2-gamma n=1 Tax=Aplysia californica TaxID=6500 RepID=A0ABM0JSM6_APLCA|nr:calcium-independent phospholipase A2-gamma [Aplysia californica]XP_005100572.1 calcium-independent phospholipase A2-gamma [Aplysia californica]